MKISPFPALRPRRNKAEAIASLPYDVMDTAEAKAMAAGRPDSFLHVVRSEIDLPEGTDPHAPEVYEQARKALDRMVAEGLLVREDAPALYCYRQIMNGHAQTAVVACCEIDDYANQVILRHEKTRQDKEDDRTRHILETNANTGQVFLTYREMAAIDWLVESECSAEPLYDFVAEDGVQHTVWKVVRTDALIQAFAAVEKAYIADGHHRSAASFRAGMARREAVAEMKGEGVLEQAEYQRFMACLFPSSQLRILPYNRCVRDLFGFTPSGFLERLSKQYQVEPVDSPEVTQPQSCAMYCAGQWYRLSWTLDAATREDPVAQLDVARLQADCLGPILGIGDPRTDTRIFFVGGIRGTDELVRLVDSGEAAVAFAMYPTSLDQMMAIADAGETMPPKSTWFEPKLRSGLLVHTLD